MQPVKKLFILVFTVLLSFIFLFHSSVFSSAPQDLNTYVPTHLNTDCSFLKWFDPNTNDKEGELLLKNCSSCHMAYYKEWTGDKHSMSAANPFFLSIYKQFKEDHPDQNGNCALCHNPEAALDNNFDLRELKNKKTNGISCDFCHKIESVNQDQLKKGVAGLNVLRICKGLKDIRFGPLKDPTQPSKKEELKYNSLYKTSLYCAKCHDGSNGNVQIYSTFTEWVNSPASKKGVQCQSCHMKPTDKNTIVDNLEIKHKLRPYYQVHSHSFLTENPHEFRKKYVDLKVEAKRQRSKEDQKDILMVKVSVENNNPGHSFPTGSPMRNAVLVLDVKCKDGKGKVTSPIQITGSKLPNYAGNLRDKPGKLFAKILNETSGEYATKHGESGINFRKIASVLGIPAQDWWNVFIANDTRIKANEEDISEYEFELPNNCGRDAINRVSTSTKFYITTKLIWRNTWPGLAKIKGFELKEDLLVEKRLSL